MDLIARERSHFGTHPKTTPDTGRLQEQCGKPVTETAFNISTQEVKTWRLHWHLVAYAAVISIVTSLNIVVTLYSGSVLSRISQPHVKEYTYIGDDYPTQLPITLAPLGYALETGEPHLSLWDDDDWAKLFPTDGFVELGPNNRAFQLSMIHQLHCLDVIRVGFVVNGTDAARHIQHCLRYLVQAVLCTADTTLEVDVFGDRLLHAADGVGMIHRCRDWKTVLQFLSDHPSEAYLAATHGKSRHD